MDSFETIVGKLLEQEHYWVLRNWMVVISKEDKRALDNHSMPRPEIDLVAFSPARNELLIVECKSYLDSRGVGKSSFDSDVPRPIRLFSDEKYRALITERLIEGLLTNGLLAMRPQIKYGLVCGNMIKSEALFVEQLFERNGWLLWKPHKVATRIRGLASLEYENNLATIMAKILQRNPE